MLHTFTNQSFCVVLVNHNNNISYDIDLYNNLPPTAFITGCETKISNVFDHPLVSLPLSDSKEALVWYDPSTNSFTPLTMGEAQDLINSLKTQSLTQSELVFE